MQYQLTFTVSKLDNERRKIRKEIPLFRMYKLMPCDQSEAAFEHFYPKAGKVRRLYPLSTMFHILCIQHWHNMSALAMGNVLYKITSLRLFSELLTYSAITDHTTIGGFRYFLEKHKLSDQLFKKTNKWLSSLGIYLKEGSIVDASIIETTSSTQIKQQYAAMICTRFKKVSSNSLEVRIILT